MYQPGQPIGNNTYASNQGEQVQLDRNELDRLRRIEEVYLSSNNQMTNQQQSYNTPSVEQQSVAQEAIPEESEWDKMLNNILSGSVRQEEQKPVEQKPIEQPVNNVDQELQQFIEYSNNMGNSVLDLGVKNGYRPEDIQTVSQSLTAEDIFDLILFKMQNVNQQVEEPRVQQVSKAIPRTIAMENSVKGVSTERKNPYTGYTF
jgi:hypothetical protein